MGKLPSSTPKKIIKVLQSKGFVFKRSTGSHQVFQNKLTGKRTIVPMHNKDLAIGTLLSILKEAGIDKEELENEKKIKS
ncbi:MAG TPA: type II toxin-antitoxin system HicA family toxin [Chitinophagales bacterium]|nr:type II toxin-antitoxin system HicA family toxin [Chitinophagales bacterium]